MKKIITSLLLSGLPLTALADNFKILFLNTPTITIGGKQKKVGDTFSDTDKITWKDAKQAMKVEVVGKKQIKLVTGGQMKGQTTLKAYYAKSNQLSTRGSEEDSLDEIFTPDLTSNDITPDTTIYLLDSLSIDMQYGTLDEEFFYIKYTDTAGVEREIKVQDENGIVTIKREMFECLDEKHLVSFYLHTEYGAQEVGNTYIVKIPTEI